GATAPLRAAAVGAALAALAARAVCRRAGRGFLAARAGRVARDGAGPFLAAPAPLAAAAVGAALAVLAAGAVVAAAAAFRDGDAFLEADAPGGALWGAFLLRGLRLTAALPQQADYLFPARRGLGRVVLGAGGPGGQGQGQRARQYPQGSSDHGSCLLG